MHQQKLRTIRLYGTLGASFGRVHRLAVNNAAEAIHALCILVPGFERFLMESRDRGLTYSVFLGRDNIGHDRLKAPSGTMDIRIAPVVIGSKRAGSLQTVVGVVLIAAATFFTGGFAGIAAGGTWGAVGSVGISMVIGGVMQMLSPQAKGLGTQDGPANRASYSFNGPTNTSAQGNPVGLLYGQAIVGSAVISAGIYAQDQL
ncbi:MULTISPECIES: tail assembly protein [Pseudomonas]|jgi:predicted phage tail protein|uniref:Phage tail protein n=1 Tax=Pseudomonas fluorescens TaxID=294 RepID=A0A5E6QCN3_PSEFL|nr:MULTISPECIES: tail assembly protein [Pseudomonas]AZZ74685.1 phage tail protein [Pseudomonas sp. RU47]QHF49237.1 phage tail protein [Pseudomonas sp. S49]WNZ85522.1 tail assembly protein [Pseudomonas sp. P108]VVM51022.1 hypothetical protein PS624_00784 [Pseudomonas fluorescens]VVQ27513.1 hypothetical protein PS947_00428 [Pseudomonas fluorescens]